MNFDLKKIAPMRLTGGARREQGERGADKRQGVTDVQL